jgi:cell wall-associated NlpC family hydrolase
MLTTEERCRVVETAKLWLGTRYRGWSAVRGPHGGVDCGQLLRVVYQEAGLLPPGDLGIDMSYSLTVAQHLEDTKYVDKVMEFFHEIPESQVLPGDLVIYKLGHAFAHGGIVIDWPLFIHAIGHGGVRFASNYTHPKLHGALKKFFTFGTER